MRFWLTVAGILVLLPSLFGQTNSRVYTRARTPEKADLDRAGAKMAWSITLPMEGRKDGLANLQLVPITAPTVGGTRDMVLMVVQMQSGTLALYDAETGLRYWSAHPGEQYPPSVPDVAIDANTVIVIRAQQMFGYDLFETDATKKPIALKREANLRWSMRLPSMPTTGAVSNGPRVAVCFNGMELVGYEYGYTPPWRTRAQYNEPYKAYRGKYEDFTKWITPDARYNSTPSLVAVHSVFGPNYGFPTEPVEAAPTTPSLTVVANLTRPNELASTSEIASTPSLTAVDTISRINEYSQKDAPPPTMEKRWSDSLPFRVFQTPLLYQTLSRNTVSAAKGQIETRMIIVGSERDIRSEGFDGVKNFQIGPDIIRSNISAPVAQLGLRLFIPTFDGTVYSIQGDRGLVLWTFNLQGVPAHQPAAIEPDLFLTTTRGRLFRVNVNDGTPPKPQDGLFADDGSYSAIIIKQFLAASDHTVFGLNPVGQLVVLDRKRGTVRGKIDMAGYTFAPVNDVTDRVYLASNEGKLICLYDPAQPTQKQYRPSIHRRFEATAPPMEKPMDEGK